jgi:hypothetical protein
MTVIGALSSFRKRREMSPHTRLSPSPELSLLGSNPQPMSLHAGYAARRISSKNGSTKHNSDGSGLSNEIVFDSFGLSVIPFTADLPAREPLPTRAA